MTDILDKFIDQAKESLASGYYDAQVQVLVEKTSLKQALLQNDFSLIAEIKRASPSGDYSLSNVDVEKTAKTFQECGATAVSIVVAQKSFSGQLTDVTLVKKTINLPVLFKDFIIDFKQIDCAKALGADAVLLIQSAMNKCGLDANEFIEYSHEKGLEVVLECHDEKEFSTALQTNADVLGVNNRDLQTLKVDLNKTEKILNAFDKQLLAEKLLISESGVKTREDALYLKKLGVSGVLVGTILWKTADQAQKIRELSLK